MKLTDEQRRILTEAADIFSAVGDEVVIDWHDGLVDGDSMAYEIRRYVNKSSYYYDYPIGPEEKSLHDLKENIVELWGRYSVSYIRSLEKH